MSKIEMVATQRQVHNGVGLLMGQNFLANDESEAADLVALNAARRVPQKKTFVSPVMTRTMEAQEETAPVQASEAGTENASTEDPAVLRAKREQEARDRVAGKPGQHQRRDMRARR